jgi:hypothetical protein
VDLVTVEKNEIEDIMNKKINYLFGIIMMPVLLALVVTSCRSTRTIQTAINKKDTASVIAMSDPTIDSAAIMESIGIKIYNGRINFNTFSAKVKLDYSDQSGKNQNASVFIKIHKDSLIWVSLTGALGVEGFRAIIKPDSVWLMDKLEKTYTIKSISSLQELTGLPFDFYAMQDVLLGNPIYFSEKIISFETKGSNLTAVSKGGYFKHSLTIDTVNNQIVQSKLDDIEESRSRTSFMYFRGYTLQQGRNLSTQRDITVTEKTSVNVKLDFKQWSFDESQTYPFNIPKTYKLK